MFAGLNMPRIKYQWSGKSLFKAIKCDYHSAYFNKIWNERQSSHCKINISSTKTCLSSQYDSLIPCHLLSTTLYNKIGFRSVCVYWLTCPKDPFMHRVTDRISLCDDFALLVDREYAGSSARGMQIVFVGQCILLKLNICILVLLTININTLDMVKAVIWRWVNAVM